MLKQNDKVNFKAQAYTNAETVGQVQDSTVFVPFMIVGETAVVKVNYAKKNIAYADVVELTGASPMRKKAECRYFGQCGGCALMHMKYDEQLVFKQTKVQNNLKKLANCSFPVLPCKPSRDVFGYRNKLSLPVRGKTGKVKIGMFKKNSHEVVGTENCLLGGSWSRTLISVVTEFLNKNQVAPYDEKTFRGQVRHLVARYVCNQLLVTVVNNGLPNWDAAPLLVILQKHFSDVGLFVNINTAKNNVILGEKTMHIGGLEYLSGQHLGVKFRLAADSFFQVNDFVKDGIYTEVKRLLDVSDTQVLVDCFSGVGILTNVLASEKYQTYGVEIVPQAVADANQNAKLNHSPNVTNICGDAAVELKKLSAKHRGQVMSLVVDPPRKGLGEACQTILAAGADNIVYISCDSATLARDIATLSCDYEVDFVQPWDMFPNTAEVETVVHLKRKGKTS